MKTYTHHALLLLGATSVSAIAIPTSEPIFTTRSMVMLETRGPKVSADGTRASLIPCPPRPTATKNPVEARSRDAVVCTMLPSRSPSAGKLETRTVPPYEDPFVCQTDAVPRSRSTAVTSHHHQRHLNTSSSTLRAPASRTHTPHPRPPVQIEKVAPPGVTKLTRVPGCGFTGFPGIAQLRGLQGITYTTEVTIGNQSFNLMVDTASHLTWVAGYDDFSCSRFSRDASKENHCGVSQRFRGKPSGGSLPGLYQFQTSSNAVSTGRGQMGYERVALAGMQISHQWIAVADLVDSHTTLSHSGVLGLSQHVPPQDQWLKPMGPEHTTPAATRANATSRFPKTLIERMIDHKVITPLFTLALSRASEPPNQADSYLGLGAMVPVAIDTVFAETPMRESSCGNGKNVDTHYHIAVGKFVFGTTKKDLTSWTHPINMSGSFEIDESATYKTRGFFSVDSSTPYIALPNDLANSILDLYSPKGKIHGVESMSEIMYLPCNASVPEVGLEIGGRTIWLDKKDLLVPIEKTDVCQPTIIGTTHFMTGQVGGDQSVHVQNGFRYVLGTPFLHNVLALFDIGAQTMRFAQRKDY